MNTLYSRQVGAIGKDAMSKLISLKVVILGCDTEGMECVKSLALMGVKKMYLFDPRRISSKYEGRLIKCHTGINKFSLADNCKELIEELTTNSCDVTVIGSKSLLNHLIKQGEYDIIVETRITNNTFEYERHALKRGKPYVYGHNFNLYGYVFSNFGKWNILDIDGENTISGYIEKWSIENNKIVFEINDLKEIPISSRGLLKSGENSIEIQVVNKKLNTNKHLNVTNLMLYLEYSSELEDYMNSNINIRYFEQKSVKSIESRYFDKTESNIVIPECGYKYINLTSSFNQDENTSKVRNNIINLISNSLSKKKSELTMSNDSIDKKFYPLGTIIGNILAHEVVKATHKYTPLDEELVFDYSALKSNIHFSTKGKYWDINALLDKELVKKIKKLKIFMVGCGALGCEISKNMAMMGFCSKYGSSLRVTDMDTIELSNLSRQFLFRPEDIGNHKAEVLESRIKQYKPHYENNIFSMTKEVGEVNENTFNKNFWTEIDLVVNALDNVEARKYVDSMCVKYDKPLFESGTLGTKGNTQAIIPYETATYSEIRDPVDNAIPMCTIRSFPNSIEHCVERELDSFSKIITTTIEDYNRFIIDYNTCISEILSVNNENIILERNRNLVNLINYKLNKISPEELVSNLLLNYYINPVREILHTFPEDMTTSSGEKFWSGKKLKPHVIGIDEIDKEFYSDILNIFGEKFTYNFETIKNSFNSNLSAKSNVNKVTIDEDSDKVEYTVDSEIFTKYKTEVNELVNNENVKLLQKIQEVKYEKDDELHNKVMTHLVNIRASSYSIENTDNLTVKLISGRVVPALSTTTSVIAGFVMIDIIKYLSSNSKKWLIKPTECNINLATNQISIYDSMKPKVTYNRMFSEEYGMEINTIPSDFNTWSKLKISGDDDCVTTVNEMVKYLSQQYSIPDPDILTIGNKIIYNKNKNCGDIDFKKIFSDMNKNVTEILEIDIDCISKEGMPVITPPVIYSYLSF